MVVALLIAVGVIVVKLLPVGQQKEPSILHSQAAILELLLPEKFDLPAEIPAAPADFIASEVLPAPTVVLPLEFLPLLDEPKKESSTLEPAILQQWVAPSTRAPSAVVPQSLVVQSEETEKLPPLAPATSSTSTAPASYVYFYTGVPVKPMPIPAVVYANGFTTITVVPTSSIHSYVVPVFTPQVVPSRIGAPKLVYSNGVVIKPKVYFPNQPARNVLRGITP